MLYTLISVVDASWLPVHVLNKEEYLVEMLESSSSLRTGTVTC